MDEFNGWGLTPESDEEDTSSVLLSLGDLMSGLLMIFALLFIVVLVQLKEREKPRRVVIGTVKEAMEANNIGVKVNAETGDISIRDSILFDENSAELKPAGKEFLQNFIPIYSSLIFSEPEFEKEITRVIIEGHTSSKGSDKTNLNLSLLRSAAVIDYIFSDLDFETKQDLRQKIMAAGRGEIEAQQDIDNPTDRKVTFRFDFRRLETQQIQEENTMTTEE